MQVAGDLQVLGPTGGTNDADDLSLTRKIDPSCRSLQAWRGQFHGNKTLLMDMNGLIIRAIILCHIGEHHLVYNEFIIICIFNEAKSHLFFNQRVGIRNMHTDAWTNQK